jgi:hypothetical protein
VLSAFGQEPGGVIVTPSALTATRRDLIIRLAARFGLPAIYSFGFYAASGGLMSYGINQLELVRSAASYVDRILRGTNPGDLPVQLPLKYELVINLKTAAALGLAVPTALQLLAGRFGNAERDALFPHRFHLGVRSGRERIRDQPASSPEETLHVKCHFRTHAAQQTSLTRSPRRRGRAGSAAPRCRAIWR